MSSQIYWANQSMSQFVKFKDLWIVCFSQPVLPWLQQIWGRGVDQIQWLIVEWGKCSFDQNGQKSIWILCCPSSAKITSSRDSNSLCFGAWKCNSNKYCCSDFVVVAAVQAEWGIVKWGKKKQRQQLQDSKIIQVEREKNPQGLMLVAVGGAAASIKAGGGLLKD